MTEIDYKAAVLNVYPDAVCTCKTKKQHRVWWFAYGKGEKTDFFTTSRKAWKSAYERLNKTT